MFRDKRRIALLQLLLLQLQRVSKMVVLIPVVIPQGSSPEFSCIFRHATHSVVRFPSSAYDKTNF